MFTRVRPADAEAFQQWLQEAGVVTSGTAAQDLNDSLGNVERLLPGRRRSCCGRWPSRSVALHRLFRNTGRVFGAVNGARTASCAG